MQERYRGWETKSDRASGTLPQKLKGQDHFAATADNFKTPAAGVEEMVTHF